MTCTGENAAAPGDIMPIMRYRMFKTMTGPFVLMLHDDGDLGTSWLNEDVGTKLANGHEDRRLLPDLSDRINRYFDGKVVDFSDVPLPSGGGEFFRRCCTKCRQIGRGKTISYLELATRAGSPKASRAAGQAMRNNRLPIIVPCHRVIGASGSLHGFGGTCDKDAQPVSVKSMLLEMERRGIQRQKQKRRLNAAPPVLV